jgi:hypothetical protein
VGIYCLLGIRGEIVGEVGIQWGRKKFEEKPKYLKYNKGTFYPPCIYGSADSIEQLYVGIPLAITERARENPFVMRSFLLADFPHSTDK